MRIQSLAVLFIIIILPITVVLSTYVQSQIQTIDLQMEYDTKLDNATYDAIKAFQLNTINSDTSGGTDSKMRDIEASVNSFYHSLGSNFNMTGFNRDVLKEYIPAIVYTMYDGFYIYSPYKNEITGVYPDTIDESKVSYKNGEEIFGLKPYVFYSCRYEKNGNDIVITYSLDNYITIQGTINNKAVNDQGYLLNNVEYFNEKYARYRGIDIGPERLNMHYAPNTLEVPYNKINDVKYFKDINTPDTWFTMMNGKKLSEKNNGRYNEEDTSAVKYYKEAKEFKERIINEYKIGDLKSTDAVYEDGKKFKDGKTLAQKEGWSEYEIFKFNEGDVAIEEPNSGFNQHRRDVIKYSIEKNLSVAISNYNKHSSLTVDFAMPELKEEEWDELLNNISMISFLQGLNIGGKVYNGYSIINNTKNKEVIAEDSIYLIGDDGYYHRPTEIGLTNVKTGVFNIDFERKEYINEADGSISYFFPKKNLGSYESIVNARNIYDFTEEGNVTNIYDYMEGKGDLAKVYFTALGRERHQKYRPNIYEK